jgi:hypothetical protein
MPHTDPLRMWAKRLIEKKPFKLVAVALANKMARIAFAIMRGTTVYREIPAQFSASQAEDMTAPTTSATPKNNP